MSPAAALEDFYAVVPAGGAGTRLWPLSRAARPKFLLDLTDEGRTLVQGTWQRLEPLAGAERILLVTGGEHAAAVTEQLPGLAAHNLLVEPSGRESMAAIGLAAAVLHERHGDVVLGSFAADHVVREQAAFHEAVSQATVAARAGYLVTIGIEADRPATAYGYVRAGAALGLPDAPAVRVAAGFTEKPDAVTAGAYLATGEYRWNAGMFVATTRVLLDHLAELLPRLHDGLRTIAAAWDTAARDEVVAAVWHGLQRIAIDHALAEPLAQRGRVAVVPADLGWDDVGDWSSLATLLPGGRLGDAEVVRVASPGAFVAAPEGLVAVLGVPDAVVVVTPDAVLVTTREHAQQLKDVVGRMPDDLR